MMSEFRPISVQEGDDPKKIDAANRKRVEDLYEKFTAEQEAALEVQLKNDPELREKIRTMIERADQEEKDGAN